MATKQPFKLRTYTRELIKGSDMEMWNNETTRVTDWIQICKDITDNKAFELINMTIIDMQTAHAFNLVFESFKWDSETITRMQKGIYKAIEKGMNEKDVTNIYFMKIWKIMGVKK